MTASPVPGLLPDAGGAPCGVGEDDCTGAVLMEGLVGVCGALEGAGSGGTGDEAVVCVWLMGVAGCAGGSNGVGVGALAEVVVGA